MTDKDCRNCRHALLFSDEDEERCDGCADACFWEESWRVRAERLEKENEQLRKLKDDAVNMLNRLQFRAADPCNRGAMTLLQMCEYQDSIFQEIDGFLKALEGGAER